MVGRLSQQGSHRAAPVIAVVHCMNVVMHLLPARLGLRLVPSVTGLAAA